MSRVGVTTGQLFSTLPAARDWRDACWQKVLRSRLLTSGHHPNPDGASVSSRMTRAPNDCATRRFGPLCDERVCVRRAARRTFPAPRLTTLVWLDSGSLFHRYATPRERSRPEVMASGGDRSMYGLVSQDPCWVYLS